MMKNRLLILFLPLLLSVVPAAAKGLSAEKRTEISQMLTMKGRLYLPFKL